MSLVMLLVRCCPPQVDERIAPQDLMTLKDVHWEQGKTSHAHT